MRELNEDADSSWSHHYGERTSGRHLHDHGHQIWQCKRNLGYDKESIKRTMLAHNATFRSQVYELHRIYDRHKELMDELKKKGEYGYRQPYASQSNSYSSQTPIDGSNKMRHIPHVSATSTSYKNVPFTENDMKSSTLSFLKDVDVANANCNGHGRRMFDLRLPADVYIDCDDVGKSGNGIVEESSSASMFPLNDDHENSFRENSWKSDFCPQNGRRACDSAYLNEPVRESFFERRVGSSLSFRSKHNENGTYPNVSYTHTKETGRERSFFDTDAGKTPSIMKLLSHSTQVNFSMSAEAMQLNSRPPEKWQRYGDLKSCPMLGADAYSYRNGFNNGSFRLDCSSASQVHLQHIAFDHKPNLSTGHELMDLNQELPNGVQICRMTQNNTAVGHSKMIFGFSIFDDTKQNPAFAASRQQQPEASNNKCSGTDANKSSSRCFRNRINLNSDPSSWEIQDECEVDLEAPDETLVKEVAETIMRISSAEHNHVDDMLCRPFNTLHWFAGVISCEEISVNKSSDDELDLFEQMTLNLEETKPEEYLCRQSELGEDQENGDERKNNTRSSLFMQRRGQGRKRRQRRDFRTDILPGLASLSRHEATEDIQTIAGLMKSTGQSWQPGATRRNAGRKATNSRARSRRPITEVLVPVQRTAGMEVGVERVNIVGWGRTTRRCRRPRCPPITNARTSIT